VKRVNAAAKVRKFAAFNERRKERILASLPDYPFIVERKTGSQLFNQ